MTTEPQPQLDNRGRPRLTTSVDSIAKWPWWLIVAIGVAMYIIFLIVSDSQMQNTVWFISGQTPENFSGLRLFFKGTVVTLTIADLGVYRLHLHRLDLRDHAYVDQRRSL